MVMEEEKKSKSENGDVWKNIIEEVKEESPKAESIEEKPSSKQGVEIQNSIENKTIDKPIEKTIETPKEGTKPEEKQEEKPKPKTEKSKNEKFTTIMLTKELKQKLKEAKDPHESYGDFIKKLLEK